MPLPRLLAAGLLATFALSGCGEAPPSAPTSAPPAASTAESPSASVRNVAVSRTFAAPPGGDAVTYDQELVPVGARATVTAEEGADRTTVSLEVAGLQPNRRYGAHAHAKPCGAEGTDAGPHFQRQQDPVSPSVDPAYANPENEIWLDFQTDAQGAGEANTTVAWAFPADRRAQSVIIHAMPTATEPGKAGTAGDRAACITVAF
jgi:superoxide dismutase, Cu-Zn family